MDKGPQHAPFGVHRARPEVRARIGMMSLLLIVVATLLAVRTWWLERPPPAPDVVVEVRGEVPDPGFHPISPPVTVHKALRAAGRDPGGEPDATLSAGTRLRVGSNGLTLETMDELLVVGLPVDLNTATSEALQAIPGIGPSRAAAIIADRKANGAFRDVDNLQRVSGIGPRSIEKLRPFLTALPAEPASADVP